MQHPKAPSSEEGKAPLTSEQTRRGLPGGLPGSASWMAPAAMRSERSDSTDPRLQAAFAPRASLGAELLAGPTPRRLPRTVDSGCFCAAGFLKTSTPGCFCAAGFRGPIARAVVPRVRVRVGRPLHQRPFGRRRPGWPLDHNTTRSARSGAFGGVSVPYLFSAALNVRGCVSNPQPIALQSPRHIRAAC